MAEGDGARRPDPGDLASALDRISDGIFSLDRHWNYTYLNESGARLVGRTVDELLGKNIWAEFPSALGTPFETHYRAAMDTGHVVSFEAHFPTLGAWFSIRVFPAPEGITIYYQDVTAQRAAETHLRDLNRLYLTLARTNQAIARATDERSLYTEVCRIAVESGGFLGAWLGQADPTGRVEVLACEGALAEYVHGLSISIDADQPSARGPTVLALSEGRPYFTDDFLADPLTAPWRERAAPFGIAASATLPLRCAGSVVAVLSLYADTRDAFTAEMRTLLEGLAGNVSFALDSLSAADKLRDLVVQRGELMDRLVSAQELERARIAAEVHDESIQVLAAANLRLQTLQHRVHRIAPELEGDIVALQETLAQATGRLRDLLFDLEPVADDVTLPVALREAAEHLFRDRPIRWAVEAEDVGRFEASSRLRAVRIAKEALTNIRKHSDATEVLISIRATGGGVEIAVSNNGSAVDPAGWSSPPGHRGITTMRDRATAAGGWFTVEAASASGGAVVRFWLPCDDCAPSLPAAR